MSSISEYRENARMKYERHIKQKQEEESEKFAEQMKLTEENDDVLSFLTSIDSSLIELESNDTIELLKIMESQIESIIHLVKKHNHLPTLQEKMSSLVEVLNKMHERHKNNLDNVKMIALIIKDIFKLTEVDIPIEVMDVSDDENVARQIQENEYKYWFINTNFNKLKFVFLSQLTITCFPREAFQKLRSPSNRMMWVRSSDPASDQRLNGEFPRRSPWRTGPWRHARCAAPW